MTNADLYILLGKEFGLKYQDVLELPDEIFHLYIDRLWHVLGKQVGMGSVGYDFSAKESKAVSDYLNFTDTGK